tara:strand:+ start:40054 stop:41022 length:969 start_codon:yes stop_codon:yes gene_type:complete
MAGGGEFDFIRTRLAPLTRGHPAALSLRDDAAILTPREGQQIVLASDMLIAGVHFLDTDAPEIAAERAIRSNLSDLAAMGAMPLGYLSSIGWSRSATADWRERFIDGLALAQDAFGLRLLGGDTTAGPGPFSISLTLIGEVPQGEALLRTTARAGEDVWVSGTIGDAVLGLEIARGESAAEPGLLERYQRPQPRLELGIALRGLASACMDVSDGLIADAGQLARASGIGIELAAQDVPLSDAARSRIAGEGEAGLIRLVTGGDDYELIFSAPAHHRAALNGLAGRLGLSLSRIGRTVEAPGVTLLDAKGEPITVGAGGFTHF